MNAVAPLVPAKVDLRSYDWFPFHHKRLRQSAFWKRASDLACRISVDFWSEAYEQVPAASLPNDDYLLSDWAGFGRRDLSAWLAVKDEVMGAWTLCSDGRWYHPTLSEVALMAWVKRRLDLWAKECDRVRKENGRREKAGLPALMAPPRPSNDPLIDVEDGSPSSGRDIVSESCPSETSTPTERHPPESDDDPAENALTRTRTRTLKEVSSSPCSEDTRSRAPLSEKSAAKPMAPRKHLFPTDGFTRFYDKFPRKKARQEAAKAFSQIEKADDTPFEALLGGIDAFWRDNPDLTFWPYPASWLRGRRWEDAPASTRSAGPLSHPNGTSEPPLDLGGGLLVARSAIRSFWSRRRWDDQWGPPPDHPGCRIPHDTLATIMDERAAA